MHQFQYLSKTHFIIDHMYIQHNIYVVFPFWQSHWWFQLIQWLFRLQIKDQSQGGDLFLSVRPCRPGLPSVPFAQESFVFHEMKGTKAAIEITRPAGRVSEREQVGWRTESRTEHWQCVCVGALVCEYGCVWSCVWMTLGMGGWGVGGVQQAEELVLRGDLRENRWQSEWKRESLVDGQEGERYEEWRWSDKSLLLVFQRRK